MMRFPCSLRRGPINTGTNPSSGLAVAGARLADCLHLPMDMHPEMVYKRMPCLCSSSQPSYHFTSNSTEKAPFASQLSLPITSSALFPLLPWIFPSYFLSLASLSFSPSIFQFGLSHTHRVTHSILPEPQTCQQILNAVGLRDALSPSAPPHLPCPIPH